MGSCTSTPTNKVEQKPQSKDLVGAVGRTTNIDVDAIPEKRSSMVALEVIAGHATIYRRKDKQYAPNGSLDFESTPGLHFLRNLLDEPVGRFYLVEFCEQKDKKEALKLVLLWKSIEQLDAGEFSIEEAIENANNGKKEDLDEETQKLNARLSAAKLKKKAKQAVDPREILHEAGEIVKNFLRSSGNQFVDFGTSELNTLRDSTADEAEKAIESEDSKSLRKGIFVELQNAAILAMVDMNLHAQFPQHSEYKRYKYKFKKVYNFISHWDFDFMQTLGKGSFGRVIRVRKKTTRKQYALKVMSKKKILSGAENSSQVTIERQVLVQCDSPYVVGLHFAFQTSRALFIALDLLDGGTLIEAMHRSGGRLSADALRIQAAQIILGIDHLHQHGILYRDLKPVNVMLDRHGNAVLTDMGLCAKFRPSQFERDEIEHEDGVKPMEILQPSQLKCVGTYGYRAPEVLAVSTKKKKKKKSSNAQNQDSEDAVESTVSKGYGPPVDYWALGVTLFYLNTAKYPFRPKAMRLTLALPSNGMKGTEEKLQSNAPNYKSEIDDEDLADCIRQLLIKDPDERLDLDGCQKHPFFSSINWTDLENGKADPVYKPKVRKHRADEPPRFKGLSDAMKQFAHENVLELFGGDNDMQDEYRHVRSKHQKLFRDWDRIPDSLLEEDWLMLEHEEALLGRE
mmetsp:Transcript_15309/g.17321  ORF Transcript_15309/g.17321 Transcript_15309/m.17321 type:complete len:682 (+) Transcript_15309:255-2300(+)